MTSFDGFFRNILKGANLTLDKGLSIDEVRLIFSKINEYFYTNYEGIGNTRALDEDFEYFSEFHKFWEKYHREILQPCIDEANCFATAEILHDLYRQRGRQLFTELYHVHGLKPEEVCRVRYFSANQDFRGSRPFEDVAGRYLADPTIFDKNNIAQHPEDFLRNLGITGLSQSDKRIKFAVTAAKLLIDRNIEPHQLLQSCGNDLLELRSLLTGNRGSGFGNKKADMFLRDMVVLGIWKGAKNFDKVDVASDINTIKVALRTGILKTAIVPVSSFLDIFCYQYGLIDEVNAKAWRRVWEIWRDSYPDECVESPCMIDNLAYRIIGKDFCNDKLCLFKCEVEGHTFKWHSPRNQTCQVCFAKDGTRNRASVINKILPCTDVDGCIYIEKSDYVVGDHAPLAGIKECPFVTVCKSKDKGFRKFKPPKSISILGQTGWESAKTRSNEGGGGLMA